MLNALVLTLTAPVLYAAAQRFPPAVPKELVAGEGGGRPALWYLLPGLFGLALLLGLPLAIARLGAAPSYILMVGTQVVASFLWDLWVEGRGSSLQRLLGGLLALAGAFLAVRAR